MGWCLYKYCYSVENTFAKIRHYRAISTRYEKLKRNHAMPHGVAGIYINVATNVLLDINIQQGVRLHPKLIHFTL